MELKIDGWVANLYKWFYRYDNFDTLPQDGCKFLRCLIMAIIFCIPFFILTLPYLIIKKSNNENIKKLLSIGTFRKDERGLISIVIYIILFSIFSVIFFFCNMHDYITNKHTDTYFNFEVKFGVIIFILTMIGVVFVCSLFFIKKALYKNSQNSSGQIKSIKEKFCIKLIWK